MKQYLLLLLLAPFCINAMDDIPNYNDTQEPFSGEDFQWNNWNSQIEYYASTIPSLVTIFAGSFFALDQIAQDHPYVALYSLVGSGALSVGMLYAPKIVTKMQRYCRKKQKQT